MHCTDCSEPIDNCVCLLGRPVQRYKPIGPDDFKIDRGRKSERRMLAFRRNPQSPTSVINQIIKAKKAPENEDGQ